MRYCIPDELFNRIPYPAGGDTLVPLTGLLQEVAYKVPGVDETTLKRETWHAVCDFCGRLGAWQVRIAGTSETGVPVQIHLTSSAGAFLRVVGAEAGGERTSDFEVSEVFSSQGDFSGGLLAQFPAGPTSAAVYMSVRPSFADATKNADGKWTPKVPRYMTDRYGECIAHGALARLYAMAGDAGLARMHATAYNNDLNKHSFGLITSGMRKHLLIDVEDWLVNTKAASNGNS